MNNFQTVVFIHSLVSPYPLLVTVITDEDEPAYQGIPLMHRSILALPNYGMAGPASHITLPYATYQGFAAAYAQGVPIERHPTLVAAIWANAAPASAVPPGLTGPLPPIAPVAVVTGPTL